MQPVRRADSQAERKSISSAKRSIFRKRRFLASHDYDVWSIDLHGYGRSDKTDKDWTDSHSAAADIAAAVGYITRLRRCDQDQPARLVCRYPESGHVRDGEP